MNDFLNKRLVSIEKQIDAYEKASIALADDNIQSYMLDTGQTVQKVTKLDIQFIVTTLNSLYSQYGVISTRLGRTGNIGKASW